MSRDVITLAASVVTVVTVGAAATSAAAAPLTLDEALRLAVAREPSLRASRAQATQARAAADAARSGLLPRVTASATYAIQSDPTPAALATEGSDILRGSVSGNQLIYDFGRVRGRADASAANADASASNARQGEADVRLDVRQRYVAVVAARAQRAVTLETLANEERHLVQIQAFVDVGQRPAIDLAQARTTLATARLASIRAANDVATRLAELARAIGLDAAPTEVADEWIASVAGEEAGARVLLPDALRLRGDLQAFRHQRRAGEASLSAARAGYLPSLSAFAGADAYALSDLGSRLGWSVGLALSWPLFEGFLTPAEVRGARANLAVIDARADAAAKDVSLALERARIAVGGAKAALGAADEAVAAARERFRLAEGRYAEGVGTIIELGDAQLGVTTVSVQRIQAELDLATARAQLLHVLGR